MDAVEKLFLTSLIAFVVPRTVVQVVAALLFSFAMLLLTMHVRPYKRESVNHLAVLSRINIFLFLLTGLLLDINPLGFADNRVATSVIIGGLMTSTAGASFVMFGHSVLRDWVQQLYAQRISDEDEEDEGEEEEDEAEEEGEEGGRTLATVSEEGGEAPHGAALAVEAPAAAAPAIDGFLELD